MSLSGIPAETFSKSFCWSDLVIAFTSSIVATALIARFRRQERTCSMVCPIILHFLRVSCSLVANSSCVVLIRLIAMSENCSIFPAKSSMKACEVSTLKSAEDPKVPAKSCQRTSGSAVPVRERRILPAWASWKWFESAIVARSRWYPTKMVDNAWNESWLHSCRKAPSTPFMMLTPICTDLDKFATSSPPRFITGTREHNFKQALHSCSEVAGANTILLQENSSLLRISPSYCDMLTTRRQGAFWTAGRSFCTIGDWVGSPRHRDPANFCPLSNWMLSCLGRSSNTENLTARLPFSSWHKAMTLSPPPK